MHMVYAVFSCNAITCHDGSRVIYEIWNIQSLAVSRDDNETNNFGLEGLGRSAESNET